VDWLETKNYEVLVGGQRNHSGWGQGQHYYLSCCFTQGVERITEEECNLSLD
jgi:hypothetical protein